MSTNPKILGLTGGIGAGKTFVAGIFSHLGIPVYNSDLQAKELTNTDPEIREKVIQLLGEKAYTKEGLDRMWVASQVFVSPGQLKRLNKIIHPKVAEHFKNWVSHQNSSWVIKEAAILFESGAHKSCDKTLVVTSPKELRIQRVKKRDNTTQSQIEDRIKNQWQDWQRLELADFEIVNDGEASLLEQIAKVLTSLGWRKN